MKEDRDIFVFLKLRIDICIFGKFQIVDICVLDGPCPIDAIHPTINPQLIARDKINLDEFARVCSKSKELGTCLSNESKLPSRRISRLQSGSPFIGGYRPVNDLSRINQSALRDTAGLDFDQLQLVFHAEETFRADGIVKMKQTIIWKNFLTSALTHKALERKFDISRKKRGLSIIRPQKETERLKMIKGKVKKNILIYADYIGKVVDLISVMNPMQILDRWRPRLPLFPFRLDLQNLLRRTYRFPTEQPPPPVDNTEKGAKESVWPSNIHAHKEEETSNAEKILSQRGSFRPLPNVHLATAQYLPPPPPPPPPKVSR
ncbi:hypothetical protein YC2023_040838 [Brassica napus]